MPSPLPASVFRRESQLLLRRMAGGRGYLVEVPGATIWHLYNQRTKFQRPVAEIDGSFVTAMRDAGMLAARPGGGLVAVDSEAQAARRPRGSAGLTAEQVAASDRLAGDYAMAGLHGRVTANWDPALTQGASRRSSVETEMPIAAAAARDRVHKALEAVGPELESLVCEVCCLSAGVEQAERRLGLPGRSGRALLAVALTRLARHYGLIAPERQQTRARMRHWALPSYRPALDRGR